MVPRQIILYRELGCTIGDPKPVTVRVELDPKLIRVVNHVDTLSFRLIESLHLATLSRRSTVKPGRSGRGGQPSTVGSSTLSGTDGALPRWHAEPGDGLREGAHYPLRCYGLPTSESRNVRRTESKSQSG